MRGAVPRPSQGAIKSPMKRPTNKPEMRAWLASLIRKRTEYLGRVEAPDRAAAEVAAVERFNLTDEQRKRLVLQEQPQGGQNG